MNQKIFFKGITNGKRDIIHDFRLNKKVLHLIDT